MKRTLQPTNGGSPPKLFTTTQWSVVTEAAKGSYDASLQALETLCTQYRQPILAFVRRSGYLEHDAQDLTQKFFLHILTHDTLEKANAQRGKFRTFLLTCLKNFLINETKYRNRLVRGGQVEVVSYETIEHPDEPSDMGEGSPELCYDRRWAETVVENALGNLQEEWSRDDKPFDQLRCYLTESKAATPFAIRARELNISEAALKSAVHRMRQRYGQLVLREVESTLSDPSDIDDELRHLLNMLARS